MLMSCAAAAEEGGCRNGGELGLDYTRRNTASSFATASALAASNQAVIVYRDGAPTRWRFYREK